MSRSIPRGLGAGSALRPAAFLLAVVLAAGCGQDAPAPVFDNPLDPSLSADLPAPDSMSVLVGDNTVRLDWTMPTEGEADEYAIFRERTDPDNEEAERLLARVRARSYTDVKVRNGGTYLYRLAAGLDGSFGQRSEAFEARPGLYTIVLSSGSAVTRERSILVAIGAAGVGAVRLSEDPIRFTAPWQSASAPIRWTLSSGDGLKTVYARLRLSDGCETLPVFNTIRLDTKAAIESIEFDGPAVRSPGETIHFRLRAGETNGKANVALSVIFDAVPLYDDGTNGDQTAEDGVYERDLVIPVNASILNEEVRGAFTDEAGNAASAAVAARLLSIRNLPEPVALLDLSAAEPPDAAAVKLRWERAQALRFLAYRIYRSESSQVDSTSRLVGSIGGVATTEHNDTDVVEGEVYYYRVYLVDTYSQEVGSETRSILVPNLRPPAPINLQTPATVGTGQVEITWTRSSDSDFRWYRLYRSEAGVANDSSTLVADIRDRNQVFWDDSGLVENTTYSYRLYVTDRGGLTTRSNQVEVTTDNLAPPRVTLEDPVEIDSTSVTLSWSESQVHDFLYYRLYRDESATVSTASTLVVEIDDPAATSFRDVSLEPETRYYYRVFVVDDGEPAKATGSNTVMATTR